MQQNRAPSYAPPPRQDYEPQARRYVPPAPPPAPPPYAHSMRGSLGSAPYSRPPAPAPAPGAASTGRGRGGGPLLVRRVRRADARRRRRPRVREAQRATLARGRRREAQPDLQFQIAVAEPRLSAPRARKIAPPRCPPPSRLERTHDRDLARAKRRARQTSKLDTPRRWPQHDNVSACARHRMAFLTPGASRRCKDLRPVKIAMFFRR